MRTAVRSRNQHGTLQRPKNYPRPLDCGFPKLESSNSKAILKYGAEPALVIVEEQRQPPFGRFFVAGDPNGYAITFHTALSRSAA
jgi:hypothetical protein